MKILVIDSIVLFESDPIGAIAGELVHHINAAANCEAELLRIPHRIGDTKSLLSEIDICKNLQLENVDGVVALGFPCYLIPHANKTLWLLRGRYEAHKSAAPTIAAADDKSNTAVLNEERQCFAKCRGIFVGSLALGRQIETHNHVTGQLLRPPVVVPGLFDDGEHGDREHNVRIGEAARQSLDRMDPNWPKIVETLLASLTGARGDQQDGAGVRRNAPCPCGSGKRYKHCHGRYN